VTQWGSEFNGKSDEQLVGTVRATDFITGFKRGKSHTLAGIEAASHCGFVRGY